MTEIVRGIGRLRREVVIGVIETGRGDMRAPFGVWMEEDTRAIVK